MLCIQLCAVLAGASHCQCWGGRLLCLALSSFRLHGNPWLPSFSSVGFGLGESNLVCETAEGATFQSLVPPFYLATKSPWGRGGEHEEKQKS